MTTDITELALREKFEAWWERTQHNGNPPRFGWECWRDGGGYKVDDDESELDGMWEAWKAASTEMVEVLEKAQTINAAAEKLVRCKGRYHSEQNYRALAALFGVTAPDLPPLNSESRTVTVKQGEVLVTVAGFTGCGKSAIAGEIEIAMKAIGVPVTWANGDAEKRMTGADWLTAIEMYKPTVRIVEENIPRAAGIKWEAE
ncbi:MAG: ead/Ea22-like family protein [Klebsiella grimontii]|nr:ead/Ea22-like family protein [Klebsiella grimontii]